MQCHGTGAKTRKARGFDYWGVTHRFAMSLTDAEEAVGVVRRLYKCGSKSDKYNLSYVGTS